MPLESSAPVGFVDTNVFIHALSRDSHQEECVAFLEAVQTGTIRVRLHPSVVHELSYALPRYLQHMTRADVGEFILSVLSWPGIVSDDPFIGHAIRVWMNSGAVQFVDAYLGVIAQAHGVDVFTKNIQHFEDAGVSVPRSLPRN